MQNDFIEMPEKTPKLYSKKCKSISLLIEFFLKYTTYITTIAAFIAYDYFIAFCSMVFSFIIMGIIRSKFRNSVIPRSQQEYFYSDKEIALWYTAKRLC